MLPHVQEFADRLEAVRKQAREAIQGLDAEALNWHPLAQDTNSLAALVHHACGAERFWLVHAVGGQPSQRVPETELAFRATNLAELETLLDETSQATGEVLASLTPEQLREQRQAGSRTQSVHGWMLSNLTHLTTHLGHMQLTRQLYEARGGA